MEVTIRQAKEEDLGQVHALIRELAAYEKAPHEVTLDLATFTKDFHRPDPSFDILIAEQTGEVVGMALYFYTYSTWKGRCLYLEDLVVKEELRRNGIGGMLFDELIKIAQREDVQRFAWQVLDWNEPAIGFYEKFEAEMDGGWINCKLRAEQINSIKGK